jgi:hypothetical protein
MVASFGVSANEYAPEERSDAPSETRMKERPALCCESVAR